MRYCITVVPGDTLANCAGNKNGGNFKSFGNINSVNDKKKDTIACTMTSY